MGKSPRVRVQQSYWTGVAMMMLLMGMFQDVVGEKEYTAIVERHWVDVPWWVWVPLIVVVSFIQAYLRNAAEEEGKRNGFTP